MQRDPSKQRLKALLLAWCMVWFAVWLAMSLSVVHAHGRPPSTFRVVYQTAAFVAAWAGVFAYRGIDRRR